jgi:hypothetical protein
MQNKVCLVLHYLHSAQNGTAKPVCKWLVVICDYNIRMGDPDLKDQMLKLYLLEQKKFDMVCDI